MATKSKNDPRPFLRVRIDDEDHYRIKKIAADRRITVQQLLVQALNAWLGRRQLPKLGGDDTDSPEDDADQT